MYYAKASQIIQYYSAREGNALLIHTRISRLGRVLELIPKYRPEGSTLHLEFVLNFKRKRILGL